jgi:hypothetical protein
MKKSECEQAIRAARIWRDAAGLASTPVDEFSFEAFLDWLQQHHPQYLDFKSTAGPVYDAEIWVGSGVRAVVETMTGLRTSECRSPIIR